MLRQLQLRAPIQAMQLKRCIAKNAKQFLARMESVQKLTQPKVEPKIERPLIKIDPSVKQSTQKSASNTRQYSVCLNPLEPLQPDQAAGSQLNRSNNNLTRGNGAVFSDLAVVEPSNSVALVPLEHSSTDLNLKQQSLAQLNMPEQPLRKMPYYNPLRRRCNVDPARVQYIKERFKGQTIEAISKKPQEKKFVSRTALHSGRVDKID